MNETRETRYIGKCKACGVASSAILKGFPLAQETRRNERGTIEGVPVPPGIVFSHFMGSNCLSCRKCLKAVYAKPVRGKFSTKHVCNAKCLASTGTVCECSCAGKNHGAAYV